MAESDVHGRPYSLSHVHWVWIKEKVIDLETSGEMGPSRVNKFAKVVLPNGYPEQTDFIVPPYIVASNGLTLFLDGTRADINDTYVEVGEQEKLSNIIRFTTPLPNDTEVSVEVAV